jgi:hypothetical protein
MMVDWMEGWKTHTFHRNNLTSSTTTTTTNINSPHALHSHIADFIDFNDFILARLHLHQIKQFFMILYD